MLRVLRLLHRARLHALEKMSLKTSGMVRDLPRSSDFSGRSNDGDCVPSLKGVIDKDGESAAKPGYLASSSQPRSSSGMGAQTPRCAWWAQLTPLTRGVRALYRPSLRYTNGVYAGEHQRTRLKMVAGISCHTILRRALTGTYSIWWRQRDDASHQDWRVGVSRYRRPAFAEEFTKFTELTKFMGNSVNFPIQRPVHNGRDFDVSPGLGGMERDNRDFAVSHQINWWLIFLGNVPSSRASSATICNSYREDEIVASPSSNTVMPVHTRSHQLYWWLTAKSLIETDKTRRQAHETSLER
ncbi:hypothetical protein C8R45DRAFT_927860 [Mycena sanguinolenta]|nr:hypothetical protein C8R45DRAFT_927860 [Mycena sanguinolenta]